MKLMPPRMEQTAHRMELMALRMELMVLVRVELRALRVELMALRMELMVLMRVQQMALRVDLMVLMALRAEMMALRAEFTTKVLTIVGLGNKVPAKMVLRETIQKMMGETPMEATGILPAAMTRLETMTRWKNYLTRKLIKEMRIRQNTLLMERTTKKHVFNFNSNWNIAM